jgi:hypothetical protein
MDSFLILFIDRIYRIVRILFTGFPEESLGGGEMGTSMAFGHFG